eukprot:1095069-Amphidinium_carterae.1
MVARPGQKVYKVKAHQAKPVTGTEEWFTGNDRADREAGATDGEERLLESRLQDLHIGIALVQNEGERRELPLEAILPKVKKQVELDASSGRAQRAGGRVGIPDIVSRVA